MEPLTLTKTAKKNQTLKTIYERRAVREYLKKNVDKEIINKVLDAGRMAPSAINKQPWKFYVVTNNELIQSFSKEIEKIADKFFHLSHKAGYLKVEDAIFHKAPVVIFITAPKENEWAQIDIGMCAQNIMLAAKSLGLDSCPVGMGKFIEQTPVFNKLGVPETDHVILSLLLGYGNENPTAHERIKNNVCFIN